MICFPNCKINIGLHVIEKRTDGFHNIETVFYPVHLCDALEIKDSKKLIIEMTGFPVEGNVQDNLCIKAFNRIVEEYKIAPVQIHLHKAIPSGAGLGGGSSDAAFMLKLLNTFFSLNIPEEKLLMMASELGSDCPFFIKDTPVFAHGRGELMEETVLDLKGYHLLIVKPGFTISTAKAYAMINPQIPAHSLKMINSVTIHDWKYSVINDFEIHVLKEFPEAQKIKNTLYASGAIYAAMSGSGSAFFGIFEKEPEIPSFFRNYFTWKGIL